MDPITPISMFAATFLMQFILIVIMFVAAFVLRIGARHSPFWRDSPDTSSTLWLLIMFSLTSIGCLVLSEPFSREWRPLLGNFQLHTLQWPTIVIIVFTLNIVCVGLLVIKTGGSSNSPFTPLHFIMPPLAIFLGSSKGQMIYTFFLALFFFSLGLLTVDDVDPEMSLQRNRLALWIVATSSFALTTLIGYLTRPIY